MLSARPLPLATAAAAAVAGMAASPDGARVLLHTSGLPPRALRALQDHAAAKDWRRMLPTLQVCLAGGEGWPAWRRGLSPVSRSLQLLRCLPTSNHPAAHDPADTR